MRPVISLIVAAAEDNAIGKDNDLLWRLPDDMRHFMKTTTGHPVIMGRRTYESFGKPLKNRQNIVLSRKPHDLPGTEWAPSLAQALQLAHRDSGEIFIIGGGGVYTEALPQADRIYLTRVHARFPEADTHFPELDEDAWLPIEVRHHKADDRHAHDFSIMRLERRTAKEPSDIA